MKRSEINAQLKKTAAFVEKLGFKLPPFAYWTPEDWRNKGHEYDEIRDNMLGWDVTDYGEGRFDELGLTLVTIRNGNQHQQEKYPKPYAEKIFILEQNQVSPMHFHWIKMEDIINRGGGIMLVQLYNKTADNQLADTDVFVKQDGRRHYLPAGSKIRLSPGESISFEKEVYHEITVEPGTGPVLAGEVSQCNDDNTDNYFLRPLGRFPKIEEDEAPFRLLCNEYPPAAD
ncbi:MAG: D-lyxose/D-mannose family sugar isomerase [Treponema sp.]|jgi:D-lyxose ketol-isomerase|nr:D-lyxose/D-mannose family sugar isomerase [Treponema sp.]